MFKLRAILLVFSIISTILFTLLSSQAKASDKSEKLTPLDEAYIAVSQGRVETFDYYDLFSTSELFVFTKGDIGDTSIDGLAEVQFRASMLDNKPVINIFDSLERARKFGEDRNFQDGDITAIKGGAAFTFMMQPFYLFLNPETKYQKLFSPEEVRYVASLKNTIQMGEIKTSDITNLVVTEAVDHGLSSALIKVASGIRAVEKIYISEHPLEPKAANGLKNYFLVIQKHRRGDQDVIQRQIYGEIQEHIKTGQFVDFIFVNNKRRKKIMAKNQKPLYER